jgi:Rrf2 family protein
MKLNKKVEIGINAIKVLKNREKPTKTADIAEEIGTTVNFLEQVMRNLRTYELVTVKRGPGGGYVLNPELYKITAYDVAQAVGRKLGKEALGIELSALSPTERLKSSIITAFANTEI